MNVLRSGFIFSALVGSSMTASPQSANTYKIDIPPENLSTALTEFARYTGLQVARFSDLDESKVTTNAVVGIYTAEQALTRMLAGSGLRHSFVNDHTVAIVRVESPAVPPARAPIDATSPAAPKPPQNSQAGKHLSLLAHLAGAFVLSSSAAWGADVADSSDNRLEEIVVTANKRTESLQNVPISVAALTASDMEQLGVKNINDIAALTPGVEFDTFTGYGGGGLTNISIRGVDSTIGASTTGIYIDDTAVQGRVNQFSNFGSAYPGTFDLNRVEVLRGPQGTLFGAGAEGGTVRFIFNQPDVHTYSGEARVEVAATDSGGISYESGVAVGGPVIQEELGFRVSAWWRTDGGYIDHVDPFTGAILDRNANQTETKAFRLAFTGKPTDWLTVMPSFYYQSRHTADNGQLSNNIPFAGDGTFNNGMLLEQPTTDDFYMPSVKLEADLGAIKVASISSYFNREARAITDLTNVIGSLAPFFGLPNGYGNPLGILYPSSYADAAPQPHYTNEHIFTQELRLSSDPTARISWVAGLYYADEKQHEIANTYSNDLTVANGLPSGTSVFSLETAQDDSQVAAFGQIDATIVEGLKLTTGVRVARVEYKQLTLSGGIINSGVPPSAFGEQSETPVTPKFGLSYQASGDTLYYTSIAKGYRVGGVNGPIPDYCSGTAPEYYHSDSVWSYELGVKSRMFGERAQVDLSGFHIQWRNIQQGVYLANCSFGYTANTGEATSNGFDLAAEALMTQHLKLGLGLAYTDAKFTKNITVDGIPIVQSGEWIGSLPEVPSPWNVTISARYDFNIPLQAGMPAYIRIEDIYHSMNPGPFSSQLPNGISYSPTLVADPATNVFNARAGVTRGAYDVALFVNNAANIHPDLNREVDSIGSTLYHYSTLRPRTIGLSANFHF